MASYLAGMESISYKSIIKTTRQQLKTIVLILTWNIIRKNKINIKTKERKKARKKEQNIFHIYVKILTQIHPFTYTSKCKITY